jgi:hypothetical protein
LQTWLVQTALLDVAVAVLAKLCCIRLAAGDTLQEETLQGWLQQHTYLYEGPVTSVASRNAAWLCPAAAAPVTALVSANIQ